MSTKDNIKRLEIDNIVLNSESLWVPVTISQQEVDFGIQQGTLQEEESKKKRLNDRSFQNDSDDSLRCSIVAKQLECAVQRFGGGTARIVKVNEFHDYPDVGQVNVRFVGNTGYGMVITKRDQGLVPMILGTGKCPDFKLMGWLIPSISKQWLYKAQQKRCELCESSFGFLQRMQPHECCVIPMSLLNPMNTFNKELIR